MTTRGKPKPAFRVVTPKQYAEGWEELRGSQIIHHDFIPLSHDLDGNWTVREPEIKAGPGGDET